MTREIYRRDSLMTLPDCKITIAYVLMSRSLSMNSIQSDIFQVLYSASFVHLLRLRNRFPYGVPGTNEALWNSRRILLK